MGLKYSSWCLEPMIQCVQGDLFVRTFIHMLYYVKSKIYDIREPWQAGNLLVNVYFIYFKQS